jgi:hypothetical protein
MAATKSSSTIQASTANTAGSTLNSTTLDLTTAYGAVITGTMTNGGTGPTIACTATCQVSLDGTTFDTWAAVTGVTTASAVTAFAFEVPLHVIKTRVSFSGNTGQSVTCVARAQYTTAI